MRNPCFGGPGSGSVKGKKATNYKDGRWSSMEEMRERLKKAGKGHLVVGHKVAAKRDKKNRNIVGPPNERVNSAKNMRPITKSQNQKEAKRGRRGK